MTTSTLLSSVSENQNQAGPFVPANAVVDTGVNGTMAPSFTLTVTPVTGWASATLGVSTDNVNFNPLGSIYEAPTGTGTQTASFSIPARRYFNALAMQVSPGATATLTITY